MAQIIKCDEIWNTSLLMLFIKFGRPFKNGSTAIINNIDK